MTPPRARVGLLARTLPALSLLVVAIACVVFARSTAPTADSSGIAASNAAGTNFPAWVTAVLAVVAAGVLAAGRPANLVHRTGGIFGMSAAAGAAFGGMLNLVGTLGSPIWWASDPTAIRLAAGLLVVVGLGALAVVASEQIWPGWQPRPGVRTPPRR